MYKEKNSLDEWFLYRNLGTIIWFVAMMSICWYFPWIYSGAQQTAGGSTLPSGITTVQVYQP